VSGIFERGAVLILNLDPIVGHEQGGKRPMYRGDAQGEGCSPTISDRRVVPVTGTRGLDSLYPVIQPYPGGFTKASTVLIDMIRGIDAKEPGRLVGDLAPLPARELERVDLALRDFLGL
jgi:mRNA-degrading endonuclease toxin of MazEF toxin-antitoxin module